MVESIINIPLGSPLAIPSAAGTTMSPPGCMTLNGLARPPN